jgi:hypothetical protein
MSRPHIRLSLSARVKVDRLKSQSDINAQDIEITLFETPKVNWGIRGMNG